MSLTLVMSIAAPWGIWQCADHRLTHIDGGSVRTYEDTSVKSVALKCPDGIALISYTGVGAIGSANLHVSDWLRKLLRGETRSVDESLIYVREAATAILGKPAARLGIPHHFLVGAFLAGQPWVAAIANVPPSGGAPEPTFQTQA